MSESPGSAWPAGHEECGAIADAAIAQAVRPLAEQLGRLNEELAGHAVDLARREREHALLLSPVAGSGRFEFWAGGEWAEVGPGLECRLSEYVFTGTDTAGRLPDGAVLEFRRVS